MMLLLKDLRIPEQTTTLEIESAMEIALMQLSGAVTIARRLAAYDDDDPMMNMLWGMEDQVFGLQEAFNALRRRRAAAKEVGPFPGAANG